MEVIGSLQIDAPPFVGAILQSLTSNVAAQSGTTYRSDANTTPLVTDGTQIWSQAISTNKASSRIEISGAIQIDASAARRVTFALFRDNTCIGVTSDFVSTSGQGHPIPISFADIPGVIGTYTYKLRVFMNNTGTWYVGRNVTNLFNGLLAQQDLFVKEYA